VAELRDARVRETVRYAAEHVPFYRDHFRRERLDPRELQSADDLSRLPLLAKADVVADPERFRSASPGAREAVLFRTSGTTGQPLYVHHDRRSLLANIAYSERDRAVEAALCGKRRRYHGVDLGSRAYTVLTTQRYYRASSFRPGRPRRSFIPFDLGVERVADRLRELRPDVLRGNGAYVEAFFRTVVARRIDLPLPRVLVYIGEAMTPEGRALVEELGIPVISRYGAVEAFKVGYLCEHRDGFHLYPDLCHVTVGGNPGEVVVSNLVNRGTVLLNYGLGDLARQTEEACPCGRTGARLVELEGRTADIIYLADGEPVSPFSVWSTIHGLEGLLGFQLVQHERDRFELRLSTAERATYDRDVGRILSQVRRALGGSTVEASFHEQLIPPTSGKFRPFVLLPYP
jgi:phenylacetate-CoA ligase